MAGITLGDLLQYVGLSESDLEQRCEDEDLRQLSLEIPSWSKYAPFLTLTAVEIEDIEDSGNRGSKMLEALQRWKQKLAFKANFDYLVKMFLEQGDSEVAEMVCLHLKKCKGGSDQPLDIPPVCRNSEAAIQDIVSSVSSGQKKFTRSNVDLALKDLTEWEELGEKLSLPMPKLRMISRDFFHRGYSHQKSRMIDLWFQYDTEASWNRLCQALEQIDHHVLAKSIRSSFMS